jgi:hypothetical protein
VYRLKLIEVLKLMDSEPFPVEYNCNGDYYTNYRTGLEVSIQFGEDHFVRCDIGNPILIPWYDAPIQALCPEDNKCIEIWLDSSGIRNLYSEYIKEVKEHEPNNQSNISNT